MRKLLIPCTLGIALFLAPASCACTCSNTPIESEWEAIRESVKDARTVFEGELFSLAPSKSTDGGNSQLGRVVIYTFRVLRRYTGRSADLENVRSVHEGTSCGFDLRIGEKLLIYAYGNSDDDLSIVPCSRTSRLEFAARDLRFLRGEQPTADDIFPLDEKGRLEHDPSLKERGAVVCGRVRREDSKSVSAAWVTLYETDEQGRRRNLIAGQKKLKEDGKFEFRYLPPGEYVLASEDGMFERNARYVGIYNPNLKLAERERSCDIDLVLHAEPLGIVSVKVETNDYPREKIVVWLSDSNTDTPGGSPFFHADTQGLNSDWTATFEHVPFSRYNLEILLYGEDLSRPTWTYEPYELTVNGPATQITIKLRKRKQGEKR